MADRGCRKGNFFLPEFYDEKHTSKSLFVEGKELVIRPSSFAIRKTHGNKIL